MVIALNHPVVPFDRGTLTIQRLSESQKLQLSRIKSASAWARPSFRYPCSVTLKDGGLYERVLVESVDGLIGTTYNFNESMLAEPQVRIEDVAELTESPFRLPFEFAQQLYQAGETGMGYLLFMLRFSDGTSRSYCCVAQFDLLEYPAGKGPADVVGVVPHRGSRLRFLGEAKVTHCYFTTYERDEVSAS